MNLYRKLLREYHIGGINGVRKAIRKKIFSPTINPVGIAINVITETPGYSVIQLGAFIGNTWNDPLFASLGDRLREVAGTLVVVEPVKSFYHELVKNYGGTPGVKFENVAISDRSGPATFFRLGVDPVAYGFPDWLSQLGSLKEERMTALWDRYESDKILKQFYLDHQVEEIVECITFNELLDRHHLNQVDLLQIDVEGYELEILRSIDFDRTRVRFVNYESVLLHERKPVVEKLMKQWGYHLVDYQQDTFCYKSEDMYLKTRWN
jgi:FkbM family methyltransferase